MECSVIVTFAIQLHRASTGQSQNQHIAMLQSTQDIGSSKRIWEEATHL